ncbi:MAG: signal transduction histidine kinase [Nitriliruptoraceae bacterium]|jgi:signal transduction histidine kinase
MRQTSASTSFPLANRTRLARIGARFAVASGLVALSIAIISPLAIGYPFGRMLSVLAVPMTVQTVVALAPIERLQPQRIESLLRLLVGTAVASVFLAEMLNPMDNGVGIGFLGFALTLSAITLRRLDMVVGLAATAIVGGLMVALMPNSSVNTFVMLPGLLVGAVAVSWSHLHSSTMQALETSRGAAVDAISALGAVVAGARESTGSDPTNVMQAVVDATSLLRSQAAAVYELDENGTLSFGAQNGHLGDLMGRPLRPGRGIFGDVLRAGETVFVRDYQGYSEADSAFVAAGLRSCMGTPLKLPDGTILGVLVMGTLTEGREFSTAATDALELLAQHAARALQLSREVDADRRTLRALSALIDRQRDFVATASHELRTPITVIDGLAETMVRHDAALSDEQRMQMLERLLANSTTLRVIVESLLDMTILEQGLTVGEAQVDLGALCEEAVHRLQPLLVEHHVQVRVEPDTRVRGDGPLLARVVDNLLTNAQRHTPKGTHVSISVRRIGRRVEFEITDDGPGISADVLPSITERFVRAGDHHTRSTRGLGIGLALVEQVLQLHGTTLEVTSREGRGSRFSFRLLHMDAGDLDPGSELPGRPLSRGRPD